MACAAACGGDAGDPSARLYDPDELPRFDLEIPPESAALLAGQCPMRGNRPYVPAGFRHDGEHLPKVGVHLKGEASCRGLDSKPAFKIKFDEYVNNQAFRGLRRMTLNNLVQDPSMIAERLAHAFYRKLGLPAPRINSALLYINGQPYGLYANIETEDKTFLRRWFASAEGNLYEEARVDFLPGNETKFELETNEAQPDRSDLARFIATLAAAPDDARYLPSLDPVLDVPHFLKFTAAEALVNQWDMYTYTIFIINNFRIYGDPASKRFTFLPWGMDHTFKRARKTPFPDHIPLFTQAAPGGTIMRRCFANPACRARYREVVPQVLAAFEEMKLGELAARTHEQVRMHAQQDTRKPYSNDDFLRAHGNVLDTISTKPAWVRQQLALP